MAIQHVNRRGDTYYLHEGKTRTGKPCYHFSKTGTGTLASAIPEGFEVYESPDSKVFLRRKIHRLVTDEEIATVEQGVARYGSVPHAIVDAAKNSMVVHAAEPLDAGLIADMLPWNSPRRVAEILNDPRFLHYTAVMRFTLVDREARRFRVERWCFRGRIDGWISLDAGILSDLVAKFCPHLGRDSFYELI